MAWGRLDDKFHSHPKVASLGGYMLACVGLHALALSWCNDHLTDGFIPAEQVPRLTGALEQLLSEGAPWVLVARLVDVGMWEEQENGFHIHDFLDYNPSRRDVLRARKLSTDRVNRWRKRNATSNAIGNSVTEPLQQRSQSHTHTQGSTPPILQPASGESPTPPKGSKASETTSRTDADEAFRAALRVNKAYQGIDVDKELARMDAWLSTPQAKGRVKTRRFIVNWLNRCDAKVEAHGAPGLSPKTQGNLEAARRFVERTDP